MGVGSNEFYDSSEINLPKQQTPVLSSELGEPYDYYYDYPQERTTAPPPRPTEVIRTEEETHYTTTQSTPGPSIEPQVLEYEDDHGNDEQEILNTSSGIEDEQTDNEYLDPFPPIQPTPDPSYVARGISPENGQSNGDHEESKDDGEEETDDGAPTMSKK